MKIKDFFNEFKDKLLPLVKKFGNEYNMVQWNENMLKQFIDECVIFPKNRCYDVNINHWDISIYKSRKNNRPLLLMKIDYRNKKYYGSESFDCYYYNKDKKFAKVFLRKLIEIENLILIYKESNGNETIKIEFNGKEYNKIELRGLIFVVRDGMRRIEEKVLGKLNFEKELTEEKDLTPKQKEQLTRFGYYSYKEILDNLKKLEKDNFQELNCCG